MSYEELLEENKKLHTELDNKKELIEENRKLREQYENTKLQLDNLKRIVFGSRREYTPKAEEQYENCMQTSFFTEEKEIDKELEKQVEEKVKEITVYRKKNKRKTVAGIKKEQLKNVEIQIKEEKMNENAVCPECGDQLEEVGKKIVRSEINYKPAQLIITNYVQYTYKCKSCGSKDSDKETSTFVKTRIPQALLPHSFASPSLATEVIYQKYYLGVPLYRQEKMWDDKGLVLPRNMMANWNIKINEYYLENLYKLMHKKIIKGSELIHVDETTMQCNKEAGRQATSNSYMWIVRTGQEEKHQGVIFHYETSRSAEVAKRLLTGFKGILLTDGYAAYNAIEGVTHAECWAHARRYFYDSIPLKENKQKDTTATGYIGVCYCNKLFKIEREIALLSDEKKAEERKEKSKPVLEEFYKWVNETLTQKIIINKKLKEALTYVINQQKELSMFITDGRIPLTNSLAERAIRPFAVHRKNWLFADSVKGAKANAVYYSLIESAKINKLNIEKYIKYLLEEIPQIENPNDEKVLEKYLPWSKELPEEILNYQGTYEELDLSK